MVDQAGTFWYHSHDCGSSKHVQYQDLTLICRLATQYCDGLRGALIVYDAFDPHKHLYDIDDGMTRLFILHYPDTDGSDRINDNYVV